MLQVGTLMLLLRRPLHRTRSILLAVALGAAILGGLTLAWSAVDGACARRLRCRRQPRPETRRQLNRANLSTASVRI